MNKLLLLTLLVLMVVPMVSGEEKTKTIFKFDKRKISVGLFLGFNYAIKYNNVNLFFPEFDNFYHSKFKNKFLGGIYSNYEINKRLLINIQFGYNEYESLMETSLVTTMECDYLAKIKNYYFENELYFFMIKDNLFSLYCILGYSINDLRYSMQYISKFTNDVIHEEKHYISGKKIGLSYGVGFSFLENEILTLNINLKNKDIFINKKVENLNLLVELGIIYKFNSKY